MSLSDYEVEETLTVILDDASGVPMIGDDGAQMFVEIYSPGTKQYAKADAKRSSVTYDKLKRKGKTDLSEEQEAMELANFLADCTKSISENFKTWFPGKEDRDLLIAVYTHRRIGFIKDQLALVMKDWSHFTKPSTKN